MENSLNDIHKMRINYMAGELNTQSVKVSPFEQFAIWFEEVVNSNFMEPNAMFLATATPDGKPSVRTVLLKGFSKTGFTFFTNYLSRKGQELDANPNAALLFYWDKLERQVRIEGRVAKIPMAESDAYFQSRPQGSQIGAMASPQSRVIASRKELEDKVAELNQQFETQIPIPRPDFWGGYRLFPSVFEFWQGRSSRLHDRIRYSGNPDGEWLIERLAP